VASRYDDNKPTCNTVDVTRTLAANSESGNLEVGRSGWRLLSSRDDLRQPLRSLSDRACGRRTPERAITYIWTAQIAVGSTSNGHGRAIVHGRANHQHPLQPLVTSRVRLIFEVAAFMFLLTGFGLTAGQVVANSARQPGHVTQFHLRQARATRLSTLRCE
jgi:hypothetical protein